MSHFVMCLQWISITMRRTSCLTCFRSRCVVPCVLTLNNHDVTVNSLIVMRREWSPFRDNSVTNYFFSSGSSAFVDFANLGELWDFEMDWRHDILHILTETGIDFFVFPIQKSSLTRQNQIFHCTICAQISDVIPFTHSVLDGFRHPLYDCNRWLCIWTFVILPLRCLFLCFCQWYLTDAMFSCHDSKASSRDWIPMFWSVSYHHDQSNHNDIEESPHRHFDSFTDTLCQRTHGGICDINSTTYRWKICAEYSARVSTCGCRIVIVVQLTILNWICFFFRFFCFLHHPCDPRSLFSVLHVFREFGYFWKNVLFYLGSHLSWNV